MRWRVDVLVAISLVTRWFGGKMTLNRMWIWDAPLAFDVLRQRISRNPGFDQKTVRDSEKR